ncbi:hypothetical protein Ccr5_gp221c [Caulobacter phage Ccr5]|nr:hypothetical protein Ccr5_gp221c [Caulobacter phage Ccr5]
MIGTEQDLVIQSIHWTGSKVWWPKSRTFEAGEGHVVTLMHQPPRILADIVQPNGRHVAVPLSDIRKGDPPWTTPVGPYVHYADAINLTFTEKLMITPQFPKPAWSVSHSEVVPYIGQADLPDGGVLIEETPEFGATRVAAWCVADWKAQRRGDHLHLYAVAYPQDYPAVLTANCAGMPVVATQNDGETVVGFLRDAHTHLGPLYVNVRLVSPPGAYQQYPFHAVRPATLGECYAHVETLNAMLAGATAVYGEINGVIQTVRWDARLGTFMALFTDGSGVWDVDLTTLFITSKPQRTDMPLDDATPAEPPREPGIRFTPPESEPISGAEFDEDHPEDDGEAKPPLDGSEPLFILETGIMSREQEQQIVFERLSLLNAASRYAYLEVTKRVVGDLGAVVIQGVPYSARPEKLALKLELDTSGVAEAMSKLADALPQETAQEASEMVVEGLGTEEAANVLDAAENGLVGGFTLEAIDNALAQVEEATDDARLGFGAVAMPIDLFLHVVEGWSHRGRAYFSEIPTDPLLTFRIEPITKDDFLVALKRLRTYVETHGDAVINDLLVNAPDLTDGDEMIVRAMPAIALIATLQAVRAEEPAAPWEIQTHLGAVKVDQLKALIANLEAEGLLRLSEDPNFDMAYEISPAGAVILALNDLFVASAGQREAFTFAEIAGEAGVAAGVLKQVFPPLLDRGFIIQKPDVSPPAFALDV